MSSLEPDDQGVKMPPKSKQSAENPEPCDLDRLRAVARNAAAVASASAAVRETWSLDIPAEVAHFIDVFDPALVLALLDEIAKSMSGLTGSGEQLSSGAWADYRKRYGIAVRDYYAVNRAFLAGWRAARQSAEVVS